MNAITDIALFECFDHIISNRPAANCYVREIMDGERPAPPLEQLTAYALEQYQAGRCRLTGRLARVAHKSSPAHDAKIAAEYAGEVLQLASDDARSLRERAAVPA